MLELQITLPTCLAIIALGMLLAAIGALRLVRRFRPNLLNPTLTSLADWRLPFFMRAVVAVACIPVGMYLVESPYSFNESLMKPDLAWPTLEITACIFGIIFFALQRSRGSIVAFVAGCAMLGIANYYVAQFKWQAIMPSDVASLSTAEAVMGGYTFGIDDTIGASIAIVLAFAIISILLPKSTVRSLPKVAINALCAFVIVLFAFSWWVDSDIAEDYEVSVSPFDTLYSYQTQGFALSFLQCIQELAPVPPQSYSQDNAAQIFSEFEEPKNDAVVGKPSIVVVMNESFSDLSIYSALGRSYAGLPEYKAATADSLAYGNAYVSAMSGGTCNSEFEFLTGSSLGFIGTGVYPYVFYDMSSTDNLVRYLDSLGYETTAIHPAQPHNWHRDRVYEQLGFERFISEGAFEGADTRRGYVTDAETYKTVIKLLEDSEKPQFIFDVTIANHGGYNTGDLPEGNIEHALVNGETNEGLDEYLSCMKYSDQEFGEFLENLSRIDKPVIVCMFGDHQPNFADELATASYGADPNELGIEERQTRYTTPYIIWTNSPSIQEEWGAAQERGMSLNYMASTLLSASGLPMDDYFTFLLSTYEALPVINLNGFMDEDREWRWFVEDGPPDTKAAMERLRIIQYGNLFGSQSKSQDLDKKDLAE